MDVGDFAERARREREAALNAASPVAAARHQELAERYEEVALAFAALDRARTGQA